MKKIFFNFHKYSTNYKARQTHKKNESKATWKWIFFHILLNSNGEIEPEVYIYCVDSNGALHSHKGEE